MAATLQTLRLPFHPSITPLNSYPFPTSTVHYSPKSSTFKGSSVATRNKPVPSSKASNSQYSPTVTENLADISIFSAAGEPGIAVVALLRHFGCPCCWEFASTLKESKSRFDSAGVKLIAVGVGAPNKARILAQRLPFPMDCLYADPDRKAYDFLDLYYGFGRTFFNPASAKVLSRFDALQKATKNYTIEATPDDRTGVLQQGGMFVFRGKELLYARKDEGTGDHAPLDDVFDVCCKVSVA
ncbi:unnamed protein product [Vicia faba]|uniref:Thioredoxin-like protein AAED1, chloroplastic n=1 Tax=Vicia faba TaxID=3906 RepID=A0AAV1AIW6_VICFA|nr:unnamed protein product [Vicia faba]